MGLQPLRIENDLSLIGKRWGVGHGESFSRQVFLVTWQAKCGCVVQCLVIITLTKFSPADWHHDLGWSLALWSAGVDLHTHVLPRPHLRCTQHRQKAHVTTKQKK